MQVDTGKLQILTVAAILVIISGGIAAYAQDQSSSTTSATTVAASNSTNSTNSTSIQTSSTGKANAADALASPATANSTLCTPATASKVGRLVLPIVPSGSQAGTISFADNRGCHASITTVGGVFNVQIVLRFAKPVTQYNVVLVANGTSYALGNMVTGQEGAGQMQNQVLLKPGTFSVSIQIFDTSSTPGQSTLVLQSAQGTIVSPPFPTTTSHQQSTQGNVKHSDDK